MSVYVIVSCVTGVQSTIKGIKRNSQSIQCCILISGYYKLLTLFIGADLKTFCSEFKSMLNDTKFFVRGKEDRMIEMRREKEREWGKSGEEKERE